MKSNLLTITVTCIYFTDAYFTNRKHGKNYIKIMTHMFVPPLLPVHFLLMQILQLKKFETIIKKLYINTNININIYTYLHYYLYINYANPLH